MSKDLEGTNNQEIINGDQQARKNLISKEFRVKFTYQKRGIDYTGENKAHATIREIFVHITALFCRGNRTRGACPICYRKITIL